MNKEELIIDYLNGELPEGERQKVTTLLESDQEMQGLLKEYSDLFFTINQEEYVTPSERLRSNFMDMMGQYESKSPSAKKSKLSFKYIKQISSIAAILILGILIGINWSQNRVIQKMDHQMANIAKEMNTQLNSNSVTARIDAIQVSNDASQNNDGIIQTLIQTLSKDPSANVRLAAAEALERFADDERVRSSMIKRLSEEDDAFVLISLINTLSEYKDDQIEASLEKLTTKEELPKFIKDEAHMGLFKVQKI